MTKRWTIVKYHDAEWMTEKAAPESIHFDVKEQAVAAFDFLYERGDPTDSQIDLWEEEVNRKGVAEVSILLNRAYNSYEDNPPY